MTLSRLILNRNPKQALQGLTKQSMPIPSTFHITHDQIEQEQLQIRAAKKDKAAFAPLYDKYYERIFSFCYQRLDDRSTAADVCSQVFLKAMISLPRYEIRGVPFGSWLFRIAFSEINEHFRKQKAQRTLNVDTDTLSEIMAGIQEDGREEEINEMLNKMAHLESEELDLLEMRFFEKRHFKEIGEIMGITDNNAKVRTYRALDKLRKYLGEPGKQ